MEALSSVFGWMGQLFIRVILIGVDKELSWNEIANKGSFRVRIGATVIFLIFIALVATEIIK